MANLMNAEMEFFWSPLTIVWRPPVMLSSLNWQAKFLAKNLDCIVRARVAEKELVYGVRIPPPHLIETSHGQLLLWM